MHSNQPMFEPEPIQLPRPHRILRAQYEAMVEVGVFADERIELISGVIVDMSPQSVAHAFVVQVLNELLAPKLAKRAHIRVQLPLALSDDSEPEPDLSIVPLGNYSKAHPQQTWLIVEVAVTSLAADKTVKADLYAAAGQPEYWLVDVENRCVLVHRDPKNGRYATIRTFAAGESVSCLKLPDLDVPVAEILPE